MRLPKISYPNPYRVKRSIVYARKIPQHAVRAITHEMSEKENALKKLLPGIMLVAETLTQNPQTTQLVSKIERPAIKTGILADNGLKRLKGYPLPLDGANVKPFNKPYSKIRRKRRRT